MAFQRKYDLLEELGKGGFSTVYKCAHKKTSKQYAAKVIVTKDMPRRQLKKLDQEIMINQKLSHPNIIRLVDYVIESCYYYIIFELAAGGELFDAVLAAGYFSELKSNRCIEQVLKGLVYIHRNNVIHRDLKPENLLLSSKINPMIKISDFGLAVETVGDQYQAFGFAGTPSYIAPEVLTQQPYGKPVDVWSTGVILYILLSGNAPFVGDDAIQLENNIKTQELAFPPSEWQGINEQAKDLISKMLKKNPLQRITAEGALIHPWIENYHLCSDIEPNETALKIRSFKARSRLRSAVLATIITVFVKAKSDSTSSVSNRATPPPWADQ